MRKPITIIATVAALGAACIGPVAQASAATPEQHHCFSTVSSHLLGDASIDGFKAWQSGGVKDITDHSATIPVTYNKQWPKTLLNGIVGIQVPQSRSMQDYEIGSVLGTDGDVTKDRPVGGHDHNGRQWLDPGRTYQYRVYIEYKFERYYGPWMYFTTKK